MLTCILGKKKGPFSEPILQTYPWQIQNLVPSCFMLFKKSVWSQHDEEVQGIPNQSIGIFSVTVESPLLISLKIIKLGWVLHDSCLPRQDKALPPTNQGSRGTEGLPRVCTHSGERPGEVHADSVIWWASVPGSRLCPNFCAFWGWAVTDT